MPTLLGAGAVGLTLGARLAAADLPLRFVVRREDAARRLQSEGVQAEDALGGEVFRARVEAGLSLEGVETREPMLLCVRLADLPACARTLGAQLPGATVVSFQNDVEAEPLLARHVTRVIGGVWRQTCTRLDDRSARFGGAGRAVLGLHPRGEHPDVHRVATWLRRAGYDVGISTRISEDLWLKLCINLMSAPNALVRREDHRSQAFVELKARLLEEARDVLRAAGVVARSCDGRDRSLEQEIAHQRESLSRGTSARSAPLYNQVWASLRHGLAPEAPGYHRRILALARRHAVPAPMNERVLHALERASREGSGPECLGAAALRGV